MATTAFALAATAASFAGLVPGVPKILPRIVDPLVVTAVLFVVVVLTWAAPLADG